MVIDIEARNSVKRKYSKKHNHYSFQDFFQFNTNQGILTDWNNSRNILATEDFIVGLVQGLQAEVGDASAAVIYAIGCEWGQKDAFCFEKSFEAEFDRSIRQTNLMFLLETWWWSFAAQGWGRWKVDLDNRKQGFIFIDIFDSAVAQTLGDVGKPICHLYAGLFSGFFTELVRKPLSCIEIQCYSMGESYCKFLLSDSDRIDAVTFWLNEGATARDIEKRLRVGEVLR